MLTPRTLCFSATAALAATTLRSPATAATHTALNPIAPQPGDWPWWRGPSLNGIAEAGEVFFTEAVYLTMNKTEVPSSEIGLLQLKGIAEKIRVFKVVAETAGRPITVEVVSETLDRPTAPLAGTLQQAPQARRACALLLDAVFCAFFISLLFPEDVFSQFEFDSSMKATAETRTLFYQVVACWVVYGVLSLTVWGATPAKRLLGIRIVRSDGQPIDWRHALARTLFSLVSANFSPMRESRSIF